MVQIYRFKSIARNTKVMESRLAATQGRRFHVHSADLQRSRSLESPDPWIEMRVRA
jgi:hypothetical protein